MGLAPLNTGFVSADGLPTEHYEAFHRLYASAGLGLVFIGGVAVSLRARSSVRSATLHTAESAKTIGRTVTAIRSEGAVPIIQLMHAGRQASPNEIGSPLVAPSPIACPVVGITPTALTRRDIASTIDDFVASTALAKDAGVSLVELHAAHGYLLAGFLSPYSNKRTDEFGGDLQRRLALLLTIIREVRAFKDVQVGVRISGDEHVNGGLTAQDMPEILRTLVDEGICYISVAAGVYAVDDRIMPPRSLGEAVNGPLGQVARKAVKIPVLLAGNITTLASADELIRTGATDVALLGRALLADPDLVQKSKTNQIATVQPCTMSKLCKYHSRGFPHLACPHNRTLSRWLQASIRAQRSR